MTRMTKLPSDYGRWIQSIKDRVRNAQFRALVAVNVEQLLLYWDIGRAILDRQKREGWGAKIIQTISEDLQREFPVAKGFATRNLKYMRAFAVAWPEREQIVQEPLAQLPWFSHLALLEKLETSSERLTYARLAADNGWSRSTLVREIANNAASNFGRSTNNFALTMPIADSEAAIRAIRDSYDFTFLGLEKKTRENKVRQTLVEKVARFMLDLGAGFTYAGQERTIDVGGDAFRLDLLFYNVRIHRYFVIEIKTRKFKPQDVGQLSFYITAIDEQVRDKQVEGQTVGILLCKSRNRIVVEYALKNVNQPIAVSTYELEKMGLASPQVLTDGLTKLLA